MALTPKKRMLFGIIAVFPTLILLTAFVVLGIRAYRTAAELKRKKQEIEGRDFKHLEVPLQRFKTYSTLPTNTNFRTYFPVPGENVTTYSINSFGMRDEEFPATKPKGEFRIAVFGDSFTEGVLVEQDQVYTKQLERILNAGPLPKGITRVRVLNMGIRGEYPAMYIPRLLDQALELGPDMILVQTFDNDAWDYFRENPWAHPEGQTTGTSTSQPLRFRLDFLYEKSDFWDKAIARPVADLERLRNICERKNLPLIVFHIPSLIFFPDEKTYSDDRYESRGITLRRQPDGVMINELSDQIEKWAKEKDVTFLSFHDAFRRRKAEKQEPLYFWGDGHFNPRGHIVAAEELAKLVRKKFSEAGLAK